MFSRIMAERIADHEIANPRIRQFALDCRAAGTSPEDVLHLAGLHRSAWFRWRRGEFSPTLKTWDRVQEALAAKRRARGDEAERPAA